MSEFKNRYKLSFSCWNSPSHEKWSLNFHFSYYCNFHRGRHHCLDFCFDFLQSHQRNQTSACIETNFDIRPVWEFNFFLLFQRNHYGVRPMMVFLAIVAICSLLSLFTMDTKKIVSGLINAIIDGYLFIVFYSLFATFKDEKRHGLSAQHNFNAKVWIASILSAACIKPTWRDENKLFKFKTWFYNFKSLLNHL